MNKLITKIVGATLGLAMAIGVGVGVANNQNAKEVNAAAGDTFELATSISANDLITFVGVNTTNYYSTAGQASNNRSGVAVTYSDDTITAVASTSIFKVEADSNNENYWNFKDVSDDKCLYNASTSSKSYLRSNSYQDEDTFKWTVSIAGATGVATVTSKSTTRSKLRFNYNNGSPLFNCYASGQSDVYIYKKVQTTAQISSVEASVKSGTYYTGSSLSASDFNVTVKWTAGKADTHPTTDFTWTVRGVENGTLIEGDNAVIVTYSGVSSSPFNVVGTTVHATNVDIDEAEVVLEALGETVSLSGTVTPNDAIETLSWSSDNEAVATVDENGVVTAISAGSAVITATAGTCSDSCNITVYNRAKSTIDFTKKDYSVDKPASAQDELTTTTVCGYTFNLLNAYNTSASSAYLMIGTKALGTSESLVSNKTAVPGAIVKVVFNTTDGASASAVYNATLSGTEVISPVTDDTYSMTGKGSLVINADAAQNLHFFAISCVTSGYNGQLASIVVYYEPSTVKADIEAIDTTTTLAYHYDNNGNGTFAFSNVSIRFGGLISKNLWNELNTIYNINGFGVMIASGDALNENEYIKDNLSSAALATANPAPSIDNADIVDYYMPTSGEGSMATPVEQGDNYFWNLFQRIDETDINKVFVAVAYFKIGDEYVFMKQVRYSAQTLAADYIANRGCNGETADGSLAYLATPQQA